MNGLYSVCTMMSRKRSIVGLGTMLLTRAGTSTINFIEMIKARYRTGLWNVIKGRRSTQVKLSLNASDFTPFYGDVMQALPDSSHDQTCDKKIVDTYYLDNCQNMEVHIIDAEQVNQFIMRLKRGKAPWLDDSYHAYLIFGNA